MPNFFQSAYTDVCAYSQCVRVPIVSGRFIHLEWSDLFLSVWRVCKNIAMWFYFEFPSLLIRWRSLYIFNDNLSFSFREVSVLVFCPFFSILCLLLIHKCFVYFLYYFYHLILLPIDTLLPSILKSNIF